MLENEPQTIDATPRPGSALAPTPAPAAPSDEPQTAVDTGAEAAFAGAESPFAYRFDPLPGAEVDDVYMKDELGIREALHAEGVPVGTASLGFMLVEQAMRNGLPDDTTIEMSRRSGEAELSRRHGGRAPEVIAAARQVFDRLDKRNPAIGDVLVNSGVANDPNFIEALARLAGVRGGR